MVLSIRWEQGSYGGSQNRGLQQWLVYYSINGKYWKIWGMPSQRLVWARTIWSEAEIEQLRHLCSAMSRRDLVAVTNSNRAAIIISGVQHSRFHCTDLWCGMQSPALQLNDSSKCFEWFCTCLVFVLLVEARMRLEPSSIWWTPQIEFPNPCIAVSLLSVFKPQSQSANYAHHDPVVNGPLPGKKHGLSHEGN